MSKAKGKEAIDERAMMMAGEGGEDANLCEQGAIVSMKTDMETEKEREERKERRSEKERERQSECWM